tara:strand:- start:163189 stop:163467 length:279 start_codon:yes stop_codon:yes gene_type:complete
MTLGLIIIEEIASLKNAMRILEKNKDQLAKSCNNYLIYTTHNKAEFLKGLKDIKELYNITYDVADDIFLNNDTLTDFHTLVYLNDTGIQYSD